LRIFVHDYAGHPFALELSRELARRGHIVEHGYFAADIGPKGQLDRQPGDADTLSITPISIRQTYSKADLVRRHFLDGIYGVAAGKALERFKPDVVLVGNTPLNALSGLQRSAKKCGAKFVLWLQDVFGVAAGALLNAKWGGLGSVAGLHYEALERGVLRRSDHVILISEDFAPYVARAGVAAHRMSVIPNWGPLSLIQPTGKANAWAREHGNQDRMVFAYTGTLGLKHNPRLLYELAKAVSAQGDAVVQVTSAGVGMDWLRSQPALPQLQLMPLAPAERLSEVYGGADVLVALLEKEAGAFSVPSKVLAYMCAGRSILLSAPADNMSSRIVQTAGAGVVIPPQSDEAFLDAAHSLMASPELRLAQAKAARAYAERTFAIAEVANGFEDRFATLAAALKDGAPIEQAPVAASA
jgi:colanic acid biosynthesis glycosyl transferase WcaI